MVEPAPEQPATKARSEGSSVEDLVRRARTGSSAAFGELVERFESPLYNFLLRRASTAEDAEDLLQETFVRAWQKLDRYDARFGFSTWLFTLARHLAATRMRSAAATPTARDVDAFLASEVPSDPGRELSQAEERASLWSIADRVLGEDARSALWLRYAEDLTIPEIARILERSSVSVRVMLFRARARLGQYLAPTSQGSSAAATPAPANPREAARWKEAEI